MERKIENFLLQILLITVINSYRHWTSGHHRRSNCLLFDHIASRRTKTPGGAVCAPWVCLLSCRWCYIICLLSGTFLQRRKSVLTWYWKSRRVTMGCIATIFWGIASWTTTYWGWPACSNCTCSWFKVSTGHRISRTGWLYTGRFWFVNGTRASRSLGRYFPLFSSKFSSSIEWFSVYIRPYWISFNFFNLCIMLV